MYYIETYLDQKKGRQEYLVEVTLEEDIVETEKIMQFFLENIDALGTSYWRLKAADAPHGMLVAIRVASYHEVADILQGNTDIIPDLDNGIA